MRAYLISFLLITIISTSCRQKVDGDQAASAREAKVSPEANPVSESEKIIPGEKIGKIYLEQNASDLDSLLGKPDLSDAAMGKALLTWYTDTLKYSGQGKQRNEINIFTAYKDSTMKGKSVKMIRITSPDYATQQAICTGNNLTTIEAEFPNLKIVADYTDEKLKQNVLIYDAVNQGISFEIAKVNGEERCIGIMVYPKEVHITDSYLAFHSNLKIH